jgi:hypothetical protein
VFIRYNTGSRADEAAHVQIADLYLAQTPERESSSVLIHGKGKKRRRCPLWARTVNELVPLVCGRSPSESVFRNRCGRPLTRFGIYSMVERYAKVVASSLPSSSFRNLGVNRRMSWRSCGRCRWLCGVQSTDGPGISAAIDWTPWSFGRSAADACFLPHVIVARQTVRANYGSDDSPRARWIRRYCDPIADRRRDSIPLPAARSARAAASGTRRRSTECLKHAKRGCGCC